MDSGPALHRRHAGFEVAALREIDDRDDEQRLAPRQVRDADLDRHLRAVAADAVRLAHGLGHLQLAQGVECRIRADAGRLRYEADIGDQHPEVAIEQLARCVPENRVHVVVGEQDVAALMADRDAALRGGDRNPEHLQIAGWVLSVRRLRQRCADVE